MLLANPGLPLWLHLVCAALTGLGGGNYSASLANVDAFYPQHCKGWALAVNAGAGNLGVAVVQLVGLLVLATAGSRQPYWVCARDSSPACLRQHQNPHRRAELVRLLVTRRPVCR